MFPFSDPHIAIATPPDLTSIKDLLNQSYRGEISKQGWTTEAELIAGNTRTDEKTVLELMLQPGSVFLIYTGDDQKIAGCVNLQQQGDQIYLGMLAVLPQLQGHGIGKKLLMAAELYAHQLTCTALYMTVISVRTELINWYERRGYGDTGERIPFIEDGLTGKHLRPLEFMVMKKSLQA